MGSVSALPKFQDGLLQARLWFQHDLRGRKGMPSGNNESIDAGSIVKITDSCNKMASADIPSKDGLWIVRSLAKQFEPISCQ
jgi:hypothetical protein